MSNLLTRLKNKKHRLTKKDTKKALAMSNQRTNMKTIDFSDRIIPNSIVVDVNTSTLKFGNDTQKIRDIQNKYRVGDNEKEIREFIMLLDSYNETQISKVILDKQDGFKIKSLSEFREDILRFAMQAYPGFSLESDTERTVAEMELVPMSFLSIDRFTAVTRYDKDSYVVVGYTHDEKLSLIFLDKSLIQTKTKTFPDQNYYFVKHIEVNDKGDIYIQCSRESDEYDDKRDMIIKINKHLIIEQTFTHENGWENIEYFRLLDNDHILMVGYIDHNGSSTSVYVCELDDEFNVIRSGIHELYYPLLTQLLVDEDNDPIVIYMRDTFNICVMRFSDDLETIDTNVSVFQDNNDKGCILIQCIYDKSTKLIHGIAAIDDQCVLITVNEDGSIGKLGKCYIPNIDEMISVKYHNNTTVIIGTTDDTDPPSAHVIIVNDQGNVTNRSFKVTSLMPTEAYVEDNKIVVVGYRTVTNPKTHDLRDTGAITLFTY